MEDKKEILSGFPKITFRVSDSEKDIIWRDELQDYVKDFEPEWRKVEDQVMQAFEDVTGGQWKDREEKGEILVTFSGTEIPHSHPLTLRHRDYSSWARNRDLKGQIISSEIQIGVLIHELCHRFANKQDLNYVQKRYESLVNVANLKSDPRPINVATKGTWMHVHTELLWKAIIEEVFPKDVVMKMEERAREVAPMYVEAYRIIDGLNKGEKRKVVDPRLR